jgi:flagellar M-ring protein FliF
MATLPAAPDNAGTTSGRVLLPQSKVLEGLSSLNLFRQIGLLIGLAASVAIGVAVVLWSREGDYRPLYGSLERIDSSAVFDVLDSNQIKYRIDSGTGALLVEADKIHMARLKLADAGIPGQKTMGFELLDREQPLGTSQFMEGARYRRSLEGELARTIASITNVRGARVHLAIPKESVFVRDVRPASASVFVELFPGAALAPAQVKSIVNLVASSIPQLQAENVTVVDQKGNLLSQMVLEDPELAQANRQLEYTHRIERRLLERVNSILEPLLGSDRFRAEIAVDVDFTAIEQADEIFNPDLPALRSEQRLAESRGETLAGGVPGALSNQPPADGVAPEQAAPQGTGPTAAPAAGAPAAASGRSREQYVRNFELDRTLSYTRHQVGKLRRLTVAVAVDNRMVPGPDGGEPVSTPWTAEELERMAILVRNAVGFDPARGDIVNVVNSAFVAPAVQADAAAIETVPWWRQQWLLDLARQGAGLLVVLILVFAVLRPVMRSLSQVSREPNPAGAGELGVLGPSDLGFDVGGDEKVTLSGGDSLMLPGPGDAYEQQITAIKGMIAEDPGRVAQVVKKWVASSE